MAYIARNKYQLPVPLDKLINIDADSFPAHLGRLKDAVDFVAPETVAYVKDDSDIGGPSVNFWARLYPQVKKLLR